MFLINIRCSTVRIIFAKLLYASIIGFILYILSLIFLMKDLKIIDMVWLLPFFCFLTSLIYNLVIITNKSGLLISTITLGFAVFILDIILGLESIFIRFIILVLLSVVFVYLSSVLSKNLMYRTRIAS